MLAVQRLSKSAEPCSAPRAEQGGIHDDTGSVSAKRRAFPRHAPRGRRSAGEGVPTVAHKLLKV
jgi:hypothetical protein